MPEIPADSWIRRPDRSRFRLVRGLRYFGRRAKRKLVAHSEGVHRIPFGPARGVHLTIDDSVAIVYYLGLYEREIAQDVRRLAPSARRVFDVGAGEGYYSLVFAKTSRQVIAFEPSEPELLRLRRNLTLNPNLSRRVRIEPLALGDGSGTTVCLDGYLEAAQESVDLLKLDVEGWEVEVLRGARKTLSALRPHVIVETHAAEFEDDCLELLRVCGYDPLVVPRRRWLPEYRPLVHNRWIVAEGHPR